MDLRLKDVAELLQISEDTLLKWIADSKIPYYKLNQQYRFSRSEIENWVLSAEQKKGGYSSLAEGEVTRETLGTHHFGLYRALHKGGLYLNVPGDTKEDLICHAVERIALDLRLDADVIKELLLDRERLMPTALSHGIAVPHTRDFLLEESFDVVVVVFPEKPIEYGALDNQKVHTLFFLFACDDKRHLHLLAKLAHFSRSQENLKYLQSRPSKAALLDYVKNWEGSLKTGPSTISKNRSSTVL